MKWSNMGLPDPERVGRRAFRCWCQRAHSDGVTFWKRVPNLGDWREVGPLSFSLQYHSATKYPNLYDDVDFAAVFPAAVQKESDQ